MDDPYILVLLASTTGAQECLDVAASISRTVGQPLHLLHVQVGPGSLILPTQEQLSEYEVEHLDEREQAETDALADLAADWTRQSGLAASLEVVRGDEWRALRPHRIRASFVVLASPHTQPVGHRETLRAALLRAGHPVVMIPPGWQGTFGRRLLVGWEDVPPLRRAIAAFSPFIGRAEQITVVAVQQDETALAEARTSLEKLAPGATYKGVGADGRKTAAVLLEEARQAEVDGIVMGAYRRGEILNWLMPGTSTRLIQESTIPLLMSP
ncbi:MAG: universal stress protein [Rhodospirillales bacterium]|nr:universal stress protein [Rhodospirillales bacterium]